MAMSQGGRRVLFEIFESEGNVKIGVKQYDWRNKEGIPINLGTIKLKRPTKALTELLAYYCKYNWLTKENFIDFLKNLLDLGYSKGLINKDTIKSLAEFGVDRNYWNQWDIVGGTVDYFIKDKVYSKKKRISKFKEKEENNG